MLEWLIALGAIGSAALTLRMWAKRWPAPPREYEWCSTARDPWRFSTPPMRHPGQANESDS